MPEFLKKIWAWWKPVARKIGRVQTRVLVTLFYWLVITPVGAIMRLFGWDPLRTRWFRRQEEQTNWQYVRESRPDLESLKHQS
ncbi:hypothetical protein GF377_00160 [candidate division GN15 bacterium]|nr:hypothetical protein [candidate division GN15 bacterium]